jgi:mediator of RNA polymerase II transcription subunit 12
MMVEFCGTIFNRIVIGVEFCSRSKGHMESAGLGEYAKHCLREICSQEWVREKFLKENDQLFTSDLLLDKMITHRQVIVVL